MNTLAKAWEERNFRLKYLIKCKYFYSILSSIQLGFNDLNLSLILRVKHTVPEEHCCWLNTCITNKGTEMASPDSRS